VQLEEIFRVGSKSCDFRSLVGSMIEWMGGRPGIMWLA